VNATVRPTAAPPSRSHMWRANDRTEATNLGANRATMPHGARASFALVSLREDATFVGGRYDNWNCPMVRHP
jgi:hypothetical protein